MRGAIPSLLSAALVAVGCAAPSKVPWPSARPLPRYVYPAASRGAPYHGGPLVQTIESGVGGPLAPEPPPPTETTTGVEPEEPPLPRDGRRYLVLQWPLPATGVTSLFGARSDPIAGGQRFHYGVDLEGRYGQVIQAAADGVVVQATWNQGHGRHVVIQHRGGWETSYSHLSQYVVTRGMRVRGGQAIGQVGNSGRSTGPHLHLEITRWGSYFDPLDVLGTPVPLD